MTRKLLAGLVAVAGLTLAFAPAARASGPSPDISTANCYFFKSDAGAGYMRWNASTGQIEGNASIRTEFCPEGTDGGWQPVVDISSGNCLSFHADDGDYLSEHVCNGDNYELWYIPNEGSNLYAFENEYLIPGGGNDYCSPPPANSTPVAHYTGAPSLVDMTCPPESGTLADDQMWHAQVAS